MSISTIMESTEDSRSAPEFISDRDRQTALDSRCNRIKGALSVQDRECFRELSAAYAIDTCSLPVERKMTVLSNLTANLPRVEDAQPNDVFCRPDVVADELTDTLLYVNGTAVNHEVLESFWGYVPIPKRKLPGTQAEIIYTSMTDEELALEAPRVVTTISSEYQEPAFVAAYDQLQPLRSELAPLVTGARKVGQGVLAVLDRITPIHLTQKTAS